MSFEKLDKINPFAFKLKRTQIGWSYQYTLKLSDDVWNPTQMSVSPFATAQEAVEHACKFMEKELTDEK